MGLITFSRVPSTKVPIDIDETGLTPANNTLVIVGHMAAGGGTAMANVPYTVENFGDPVVAATELDSAFGGEAEATEMVVAAITAVLDTDLPGATFPPIIVIPMAFGDDDMAAALNANIGIPMPFLVNPYPASDSAHSSDFQAFLDTISGEDRGRVGQFGSFGSTATDEDLSPVVTEATTAADETMLFPWLRDLAEVKANDTIQCAAALGALAAANPLPYLPLNDVKVGGLKPPTDSADQHTPGDAGTEASGLEGGAVPLMTDANGAIRISRTVTSRRTEVDVANTDYIDMQDWQTLYYLREQAYILTQQDRYKRARNSPQKQAALKSELIHIMLDMEDLEMLENVEGLVNQIVVTDAPGGNVYACQIDIPVDVIPGFMNKGIFLHGVTSVTG